MVFNEQQILGMLKELGVPATHVYPAPTGGIYFSVRFQIPASALSGGPSDAALSAADSVFSIPLVQERLAILEKKAADAEKYKNYFELSKSIEVEKTVAAAAQATRKGECFHTRVFIDDNRRSECADCGMMLPEAPNKATGG